MHSGYQLSSYQLSSYLYQNPTKRTEPIPDPTHLRYGISLLFLFFLSSVLCALSRLVSVCSQPSPQVVSASKPQVSIGYEFRIFIVKFLPLLCLFLLNKYRICWFYLLFKKMKFQTCWLKTKALIFLCGSEY